MVSVVIQRGYFFKWDHIQIQIHIMFWFQGSPAAARTPVNTWFIE